MNLKKHIGNFFIIFIIFLFVPVIGTQLHEMGHYIAGLSFGCHPMLRYAFTTYSCPTSTNFQYFVFILAGPLATWIESLIPLIIFILVYKKERIKKIGDRLPALFLLLFSFASFCARFVFNAGGYLISKSNKLDEYKMETYLNVTHGVIIYGFAFVAIIILLFLLSRIPKPHRYTFIPASIIGAILGYIIWYYYLGPILLP